MDERSEQTMWRDRLVVAALALAVPLEIAWTGLLVWLLAYPVRSIWTDWF